MFKTGSKFLYGLAGFGYVAAIAYAAATNGHKLLSIDSLLGPLTLGYKGYVGEHVGFAILVGLSAVSLFLGIFLSALRDSDAEAAAQVVGLETVPEVVPPTTVNYWPIVGGFSAASLVLGLAVGPELFVLGLVGLTIVTVEWAVRAWSDRATGDTEVNRGIRNRMMYPVEIPVGAVLGIAVLVLAVSRILLALPKVGSDLVFGLVPVFIIVVGALFVLKPKMSQSVIAGLILVGGLAILAGGVAAAIAGEHKSDTETEEGAGRSSIAPLPEPGKLVVRVAN